MHFRARRRLVHGHVDVESEARSEARGAQNAERVVPEGFGCGARSADDARGEVGDAAHEVLHLCRVHVVEQRVDGEVASQRVLECVGRLH